MKTKEQKYDEAVERNISNLERRGLNRDSIWEVRLAAGIRRNDNRFDKRIEKLFNDKLHNERIKLKED
jgi:hypothetical protein